MFGDGATNQGTFGESMNLAALWSLPVVFMVINNQFGMGTSLERHSAVTDLSRKAEGFGVPGTRCDGMDVLDVHASWPRPCARRARSASPQLVEAVTYRFRGHSMADPEEYRTKDRSRSGASATRSTRSRERLATRTCSTRSDVEELDAEAMERVDEAVEFADASPFPDLDSLYDDIYVYGDQVRGWYSVDERSPEPHRGEREREAGESRARAGRGGRRLRRRRAERAAAGRQAADGEAGATIPRSEEPLMPAMRYREALNQALREEMQARRERLPDGRGHRRLPGRLQGHRRAARGVRREARARHPDLREHDRRRWAWARR